MKAKDKKETADLLNATLIKVNSLMNEVDPDEIEPSLGEDIAGSYDEFLASLDALKSSVSGACKSNLFDDDEDEEDEEEDKEEKEDE